MSLVEISEEDIELVENDKILENDEESELLSTVYKNDLEGFFKVLKSDSDLNVVSKSGASLAHLAVANNNMTVLRELVNRGIDIHHLDNNCNTLLHAASKKADSELILYLIQNKIEINFQNKQGDTALHCSVTNDNLEALEIILNNKCCKINIRNKNGESSLCLAVIKGKVDIVHKLLLHRADLNIEDKDGHTPLHHSIGRHQTTIALMLINAGVHVNQPDRDNNTPLHLATSQGLLPVVQALCAYGCKVDCYNNEGLTALQLGARIGFIDVVRCLLLAGASPFIPSKDNVYPDIMAYARGHKKTGYLLHTMSPEKRAICIEQLIPSNRSISKIKLKVFGSSMSGKTTLINCLESGYIKGILTNKLKSLDLFNSQESNSIIMKEKCNNTDLRYELDHEDYTRAIEIKSINISGCGEMSSWEFSGYEPYYCTYDHFIGDTSCIHLVVLSMRDSIDLLRHKLRFWLEFISARISPAREMLDRSRNLLAKVLIVCTHSLSGLATDRNADGLLENSQLITIFKQIKTDFECTLEIHENLIFVDSEDRVSIEFKNLRAVLAEYRTEIVDQLPFSNQLVETAAAKIHTLIHKQEFPSLSWQQFVERVRDKINPLCNEDHLKDLIQQLQFMGEVIYLDTESEPDIIILSPNWLCNDVIGYLLSFENISSSRVTGTFNLVEVQMMLGVVQDVESFIRILGSLDLCVEVEADDEVQYEFPSLNFVEAPSSPDFLSNTKDAGGNCLGCQVHANAKQLVHLMTRIQVQLRRSILDNSGTNTNGNADDVVLDLDQWYHGSSISTNNGCLVMITMESSNRIIEIKARAPKVGGNELPTSVMFGLFQDAVTIVLETLNEMCGSLDYEIFYLGGLNDASWLQRDFTLFSQGEIMRQMLEQGEGEDGKLTKETRVMMFADHERVMGQVKLGPQLHVSSLRLLTIRKLCHLFDPPDHMGRDWCLLAVKLGLKEPQIAKLDKASSKTAAILTVWGANQNQATIKSLIDVCVAIDRMDAAFLLVTNAPLYQFIPFVENQSIAANNTNMSSGSTNQNQSSPESRSSNQFQFID